MVKLVATWMLMMMIGTTLGAEMPAHPRLQVGESAPSLQMFAWLKGGAVNEFERGRVYVIEFWATWCLPCISEFPHLSRLAARYSDSVTVIGINVLESKRSPNVTVEQVQQFVDRKGDKMSYVVAMDDPVNNTVFNAWLAAAGLGAIPNAIIVDQERRIAWIGHPSRLEQPIKQLLAGTFDIAAAKSAHMDLLQRGLKFERRKAALEPIQAAIKRQDYEAARQAANDLIQQNPQNEVTEFWAILPAYLHADAPWALSYVRQKSRDAEFLRAMGFKDERADKDYLERVATVIAQTAGYPRAAYEFASSCIESSLKDEPTYFKEDVLAQAWANMGDLERAIAGEERALAMLKKTDQPGNEKTLDTMSEMIKERLIHYRELWLKERAHE